MLDCFYFNDFILPTIKVYSFTYGLIYNFLEFTFLGSKTVLNEVFILLGLHVHNIPTLDLLYDLLPINYNMYKYNIYCF